MRMLNGCKINVSGGIISFISCVNTIKTFCFIVFSGLTPWAFLWFLNLILYDFNCVCHTFKKKIHMLMNFNIWTPLIVHIIQFAFNSFSRCEIILEYFPSVFRLKATTGSHTSLTHIVYNPLNYILSVASLKMINNLLLHTANYVQIFKSLKQWIIHDIGKLWEE